MRKAYHHSPKHFRDAVLKQKDNLNFSSPTYVQQLILNNNIFMNNIFMFLCTKFLSLECHIHMMAPHRTPFVFQTSSASFRGRTDLFCKTGLSART